jgi:hypothetical protein
MSRADVIAAREARDAALPPEVLAKRVEQREREAVRRKAVKAERGSAEFKTEWRKLGYAGRDRNPSVRSPIDKCRAALKNVSPRRRVLIATSLLGIVREEAKDA